ncbi:hypothetical protein AcV5_009662 [Taiwanofungus camphoratus]|nr:hypothetical protein AcV5_009662 [Antrodia cinnamomea]KAI0942887.1 hypothetical protein AcV7_002180 [Antrodia cinnamomea]
MEAQCEPGTSVSTIRGLHRLNGDTNFVHNLTLSLSSVDTETIDPSGSHPPSRPSSPHSALPSPSSPSGDSVSSFPSVSSSFLFSSGPTSPPHLPQFQFGTHADADSDVDLHDSTAGLIIPSLALPSPARRPTPYGQTLGDLRILILAPSRSARSTAALVAHLLEENEDIVELGTWEEEPRGDDAVGRVAVLRASTDWVEHRDAHGLERVEPARNVEIVELPGYDPVDNADDVLARTLPIIHAPFYQVFEALNPEYAPSSVLANLLSSACTPLYTALILLLTSSPSPTEKMLISKLSPHIPLIVVPPLPAQPSYPSHTFSPPLHPTVCTAGTAAISAFRPATPYALRSGLFRSPETLALLRSEGAARFMRWREVERAVERISAGTGTRPRAVKRMRTDMTARGRTQWNKAEWEAEWEASLSQDIAIGLRRRRAGTALPLPRQREFEQGRPEDDWPAYSAHQAGAQTARRPSLSHACAGPASDPLHLKSVLVFSLSLFGPLRERIVHSMCSLLGLSGYRRATESTVHMTEGPERGEKRRMRINFGLGLALVGAFCAGICIDALYRAVF